MLVAPIITQLSDLFGRRVTFLIPLYVSILSNMICAFAPNYTFFLVFRFIAGVATSVGSKFCSVSFSLGLFQYRYDSLPRICLHKVPKLCLSSRQRFLGTWMDASRRAQADCPQLEMALLLCLYTWYLDHPVLLVHSGIHSLANHTKNALGKRKSEKEDRGYSLHISSTVCQHDAQLLHLVS